MFTATLVLILQLEGGLVAEVSAVAEVERIRALLLGLDGLGSAGKRDDQRALRLLICVAATSCSHRVLVGLSLIRYNYDVVRLRA